MQRVLKVAFAISFIAFVACACTTSARDADEVTPIVWKLDSVSKVGGHAVRALGSPPVVGEGEERAVCFNGASDALLIDDNPILGWRQFTIEALIKPDAVGPEEQRFLHIQDEHESRLLLETRLAQRQWALDTFLFVSQDIRLTLLDRQKAHPAEQWHWVALTFDGETMRHYVEGEQELEGKIAFQPMTKGRMSIGVRLNQVSWFKGCIREIRFTPAALQQASLQK